MRRHIAVPLILLAIARPGVSQTTLDRGTLLISRGGGEAGRVEFSVRSTTGPTGDQGKLYVGTTRTPSHEVQYATEVDRLGALVNYQLTETNGGRVVRRISAQVAGPRLTVHSITDAGESSRQLPARASMFIFGDEDFSSYYSLPRPDLGERRQVVVFRIESMASLPATVVAEGDDHVSIGAQSIPCQRFALQLPNGESAQYWFSNGLLIKVASSAGVSATRTQVPTQ